LTANSCAKNILIDNVCNNCTYKIDSSDKVWCYIVINKPNGNTCKHFIPESEIIASLKNYIKQKHI